MEMSYLIWSIVRVLTYRYTSTIPANAPKHPRETIDKSIFLYVLIFALSDSKRKDKWPYKEQDKSGPRTPLKIKAVLSLATSGTTNKATKTQFRENFNIHKSNSFIALFCIPVQLLLLIWYNFVLFL